ncbi:amino acid adenylation domain-containing protein [Clostridium tyrobutyricum]|uniref:amino acid adenylation domain-containing protein n=1 Tax=Clostridium tyrobutyricum TaxID=1519 RepID=UPI001C390EED|nr:amino acid adenylation domain-containing protein [Clostridium tyrobutyricum]MBV4429414.1 amino acid adenylation domain-containing protein [Clostridium tyrobutyricum]MBV4444636.1 amino acid adenylation domain-containing protein [Clostridium tyrobutyricum]
MTVEKIILKYQDKGVQLEVKDEKLTFSGPKGVIDSEARKEIQKYKKDIISYLNSHTGEVICDKDSKYEPFKTTDIQSAYVIGRNNAYKYGGVGCKIYAEYKYPRLEQGRLKAAWENVVKANDMLYAIIIDSGKQRILENYEIPKIRRWGGSEVSLSEGKEHIEEVRNRMTNKQYEVGAWPLYDLEVTDYADISVLHIALDMLIADFLSISIIIGELEENYYGTSIIKEEKELSYRDVIIYESNRKKHPKYLEKLVADRTYWKKRIPSIPEGPDIPTKEEGNKLFVQQFNLFVDRKRHDVLQNFAEKNHITLSGLILAFYTEVLAYWSSQKRFCINVTMANRENIHPDIYNIVGDFTVVDILEVKNDIEVSFFERLKFLQNQLWHDLEHLSYTGVEVIREMTRLKKKEVIIPYVFTSTLGVDDIAIQRKIKGELLYKISQTPQVLVDCQVMKYNEGILVNWDVREDVFPKGMIEAAFEAFSKLINLFDIEKMKESHNVVELPQYMKKTRSDLEINYGFTDTLIHDGFCKNVKKYPSRIALYCKEREYSYQEVGDYAVSIKNKLIDNGIKNNDIVAIELEKGIWQIAAVLGVLLAGGTYLPTDMEQPRNRKDKIEMDAPVKFIITSEKNAANIDFASVIKVEDVTILRNQEVGSVWIDPQQAAYIIYTSGSTGEPKGVVISHLAAMNTIKAVIKKYEISYTDRVLGVANLAFDLSVFDIFGMLTAGGTLILPTGEADITEWSNLILNQKVTIWNTVPAQMQMLISYLEAEVRVSSELLRLIMLSGDWIPVNLPKRMHQMFKNAKMVSLGGATEASIWSIAYEIDPQMNFERSIPYGTPLANQSFYILDSKMQECPDYVRGTLYIGGKGLATKYLGDSNLTKNKFVFHKGIGMRLYNTGDFGRYMPDGIIEFLGRMDEQVKIRGHRVELNEIETVINQHHDVEYSVVVTAKSNTDIMGAYIQPYAENNTDGNLELVSELKKRGKAFNHNQNIFEVKPTDFAMWLRASNQTAVLDMINTFLSKGIFTDQDRWYPLEEIYTLLGVHEYYEPLIRRWLKTLKTEGYVISDYNKNYKAKNQIIEVHADDSWHEWTLIDSKVHYNDLMMKFFKDTRENLLPLLQGKLDPIDLFFPKGSFKVALAAYKDNIVSTCTNKIVVENVLTMVNDFILKNPNKKFRILEVGAGVGGVSIDLIEALKEYDVEYLFTDISRSFLNEAQIRFEKYPWIKFGLYDINEDYWRQNLSTSVFNVILCNNVLHNANDELKVLRQFKEMSIPNGKLVIIDATGNNYALLTSIEFLNGLNGVEDFRAENEQVFLSQEQWENVFEKAGIELISAFPENNNPLKVMGQTVFVVNLSSNRRRIESEEMEKYLAKHLPKYMIPTTINILDEMPLTLNGKIDRNVLRERLDGDLSKNIIQGEEPSSDVEKALAEIWKESLHRSKVWKNENFYEAGGDSLLVAQVVAKMKEKLPEARDWEWDKLMIAFVESPTIEEICKKLRNETQNNKKEIEEEKNLIVLNAQESNNAIVLVHDGTGTISPYNYIVPYLTKSNNCLMAIQCDDMDEYITVEPERLIPFLGEKYAQILLKTGKQEFNLIGYCMGGLIALEIAKVLTESGKKVKSFINIDTTPSRRMLDNELLMERAFGMIIGADIKKVGHTVEDSLLKKAINKLGEEHREKISNDELLNLHGEFLPISQCYKKLVKKTHEERLNEIYNTIPNANYEILGHQKARFDTLYRVFCHSFRAVISYDPGIYMGDAIVLSCKNKNSSFLPVENTDNEKFWNKVIMGNIKMKNIEGEHLTCMSALHAENISKIIMENVDNE